MVATEQRRFGLADETIADIQQVFSQNTHVERVLLFGSRAMGTYKNGSDIDLALFGTYLTYNDLIDLRTRLDALPYAYTYDLIDYARTTNPALRATIDDMGLPFYEQQRTQLPEGWREYELGEVAEINPKVSLKQGQEYSFVEMKDLNPSLKYVQPSAVRELKGGAKFQDGDTLFARITPCLENGKISQVRGLKDEVGFGSTEFLVLRGKTGLSDTDFIYHLSRTEYVREKAIQAMTGTSGRQRVEKSAFEKITVTLPPLSVQQEIAAILSALDDKIELNRQMNQTLENIAQTLFTEWFVKFNFPGFDGELVDGLPKGWRKQRLTDLVDTVSVTHRFPDDKVIFLNTSDIYAGEILTDKYSDIASLPGQAKKTIKINDILFSEIRPANKRYAFVDFDSKNYVVSTKLMVLRSKNIIDPLSIYYFMKMEQTLNELQVLAESRSGTFPQITYTELNKLEMVVADEETNKKYASLLNSTHHKIRANQKENQTLTQLRDNLLPRLLSGKIAVGIATHEV